jgi:RNA polymerase subunit RPABC4/transcription elongation factor Spt4
MKCLKCKHELKEDEKFCPQCGEKVMAKDGDMDLIDLFTKVSQVWFSLGVKYGVLHERKDLEAIKKMEEKIREDPEFCEFYDKSLNYAKENTLTKLNKVEPAKASQNGNAH